VEGGWLFNDLKAVPPTRLGDQKCGASNRDKIDFMSILSRDQAKYLSLRKCYPTRVPLKSATTSATRMFEAEKPPAVSYI
jgi:hypothetical protein